MLKKYLSNQDQAQAPTSTESYPSLLGANLLNEFNFDIDLIQLGLGLDLDIATPPAPSQGHNPAPIQSQTLPAFLNTVNQAHSSGASSTGHINIDASTGDENTENQVIHGHTFPKTLVDKVFTVLGGDAKFGILTEAMKNLNGKSSGVISAGKEFVRGIYTHDQMMDKAIVGRRKVGRRSRFTEVTKEEKNGVFEAVTLMKSCYCCKEEIAKGKSRDLETSLFTETFTQYRGYHKETGLAQRVETNDEEMGESSDENGSQSELGDESGDEEMRYQHELNNLVHLLNTISTMMKVVIKTIRRNQSLQKRLRKGVLRGVGRKGANKLNKN